MTILDLWLPILLSAVFVFLVSSVIHMATPLHKSDFKKMPNEDEALAAMRANGLVPGQYVFPCAASMADMGSPEMSAKMQEGPIGFMTVMPNGSFRMGRQLIHWFLFSLLIGVCAAYMASIYVNKTGEVTDVFRITATVGVLGFALSHLQDSIWKGQLWVTTCKFLFDGVLYGIATGAAFAWFWPGA